MKNNAVLFILAFLFSFSVLGQDNLKKIVCDAHTRMGIPFSTIKVINKPVGAYANEAGWFVVKALKSDSLLVSCVGYKPERLLISLADTIFLQPVVVALAEVNVNAKKRKEHRIGYYNTKKRGRFGSAIQIEYATKIIVPQEYMSYQIKKVKIKCGNRNENHPVRLHIYSQGKDGLPDKELLSEDILINKCIKANDEIDLAHLNMVLSDRILFVGIEWIEPYKKEWNKPSKEHKPRMFEGASFGCSNGNSENQTYSRTLRDPYYRWKLSDLFNSRTKNLMVSLIID